MFLKTQALKSLSIKNLAKLFLDEKLISWSDKYQWSEDEVLTWVSLYYFSDAGPEASSYHYYEAIHGSIITVPVVQNYINVPLGLADFPVEISNAPKSWWGTLGKRL
jgi:hypothetical protein